LKGTAASKEFAKRWKACPQLKKDELQAAYKADMKEYNAKFDEYKKTEEYANFKKISFKKKFKKAPKDKNAPKKPLTPFFIFSQEKRSEVVKAHPEMKLAQIGKKMGEMWQALSQEEKDTYIAQQKKAKEVYKEVRAAYEQTEEFAAYQVKKNEWYAKKKRAQKEARKLHFKN
jgi:structure-specific recognition protein 1